MNHNDREHFWQTLCSLPGNDIAAEREQLFKAIKYPKLLFRYRPVSAKSLEALRTNKLYFSSANYYDDPFDTFLHIDIEAIRNEYLSAFQTPESTEAVVQGVKSLLGGVLSKEQAAQLSVENVTHALSQGLTESFLNAALSLRDEVKKDTWSVCYCETFSAPCPQKAQTSPIVKNPAIFELNWKAYEATTGASQPSAFSFLRSALILCSRLN